MRIFVLEDDATRRRLMGAVFAQHDVEVTWAENVAEAEERWTGGYDLAFLDHDLDLRLMDNQEANTGYQFLKGKTGELGKTVVVLHSWNPDGVKGMMALALGNALTVVTCPFGKELLEMIPRLLPLVKAEV